jgi:hypothetical protein
MTSKNSMDKFYTNPDTVDVCLKALQDIFPLTDFELIVEPSAGSGNFYTKLPTNKVGLDILPEHPDIIKQDFFDYIPDQNIYKNILVVGNPPFGKSSSLAIKFFNHAAKWSNVIAFIVPRTFRRISVQNKLSKSFHITLDINIPTSPCSFTPKMAAKCCFQIYQIQQTLRKTITLKTKHPDWEFLSFGPKDGNNQPTPPINADFAIRAYGGKCGEIVTKDLQSLRPKSWHWIKSNIDISLLISRFNKLDYSISLDTARQNSIGRGDLVMLYSNSKE